MKTYSFLIISGALLFASCVKDSDYDTPNYDELQQVSKTQASSFDGKLLTYAEFRAKATSIVAEYTDNEAFEGYVISSDEGGNFYKKIYVQAPDKSGTIAVSVERKGLFGDYPIGTKVQIRLKGTTLWYNSRYSIIEVGYGSGKTTGGYDKVSNLPPAMIDQVIVNTGEKVAVSDMATTFSDIKNMSKAANTNLLITLQGVHFESNAVGQTFYKPTDQYSTSYKLEDDLGGSVTFLTSSYATHIQEIVPDGKLNVTGILTKYNSTYQFYISTTNDIRQAE